MSAKRASIAIPIALGFRAGRGGSVVVAVATKGAEPRLVLSTFLATAVEGDRLSLEPYQVASELACGDLDHGPAQAAKAVAEGRKSQNRNATKGLAEIQRQLAKLNYAPVVGALLVNRAGWIADLLQYSLMAPEHPAVAEGLAVRDALRIAMRECGIPIIEMDEKSLIETGCEGLRMPAALLETKLKNLGATAGKPWRKDQRLACLAAWLGSKTR